MEPIKVRRDINGNIISKSNKDYHISFKENFSEIIKVESYKEYNILNDESEFSTNYDDEENEDKFNINEYNPEKVEKTANHDPRGFSRAKCLII